MIMVILSHTLKVIPVRQVDTKKKGRGGLRLSGVCTGQGTSRLGFSPAFDLAHAVHTENADLLAVTSVADQEVAVFDGAIQDVDLVGLRDASSALAHHVVLF